MQTGQPYNACTVDDAISAVHFCEEQIVFPPHFHRGYVFGFVAGGSSTLLSAGEVCELQPGAALAINPEQIHRCAARSTLDYISLHVPVAKMQWLSRAAGHDGRLPRFQSLLLEKKAADCLEGALRENSVELRNMRFVEFLARFFPAEEADGALPHLAEVTRAACTIIDHEYALPSSLDSLAQRCSLSVSTLRRRFTQDMGISPHGYLLSTRMEHARVFLRGGCSAADTAQRTGFCDQSHFIRVFRRYFGLTPGVFTAQQLAGRTDER